MSRCVCDTSFDTNFHYYHHYGTVFFLLLFSFSLLAIHWIFFFRPTRSFWIGRMLCHVEHKKMDQISFTGFSSPIWFRAPNQRTCDSFPLSFIFILFHSKATKATTKKWIHLPSTTLTRYLWQIQQNIFYSLLVRNLFIFFVSFSSPFFAVVVVIAVVCAFPSLGLLSFTIIANAKWREKKNTNPKFSPI